MVDVDARTTVERKPIVFTRMLGADADIEFAPILTDAIAKLEARFASPDFAIVFADADEEGEEDDVDQIIVCRRWGGVLMPAVYVGADELEEYESTKFDWIGAIAEDLARTEADIAEVVAAEETGE